MNIFIDLLFLKRIPYIYFTDYKTMKHNPSNNVMH